MKFEFKHLRQCLLALAIVSMIVPFCFAQIEFTEHIIADDFNGAYGDRSVYAADIDGDGDMDVLGATYCDDEITWFENDGEQEFTEHTIADNFSGAHSVYSADIDGDGDMDVLGAASGANDITWWENDGEQDFTEHTIAGYFDGASSVYAADLDSDGDMDVLGAAAYADDITWWENDGEQEFTEHTIAGNFDDAQSVYAADIDGDGDMDALGAGAGDIAWWENDGEQEFTEHTIASEFEGACSVYAADIDSDDDMDVLGAARRANDITWWENDGEQDFTEHTIADDFRFAYSVLAVDIDGDNDMDVLGAAEWASAIIWWENDGEQDFTEHTIAGDFDDAISVYAADIDGDGDLDVLGAAYNDGITWWESDLAGGFLEGIVFDIENDSLLEGVTVSTSNGYSTQSDSSGFWNFERFRVDTFDVTFSVSGYNDSTIIDQYVEYGDTLELSIGLLHPELLFSEKEIVDQLEYGGSTEHRLTMQNDGNGPLEWSVEPHLVGESDIDPWEMRGSHLVGQTVNDSRLQGVVYVDGLFYVSGGGNDDNMIYLLDDQGELVDSYPQLGNSRYGITDLTWDGENIWGVSEEMVYCFTTGGDSVTSIEGPPRRNQAITWDADRELLWIGGVTNDIHGYDREGIHDEVYDTEDDFYVSGTLIAHGTEDDSITFRATDSNWRGMEDQDEPGQMISFQYVRSFNSRGIIRGDFHRFQMTESRVSDVRIEEAEEFIVFNNEFSRGGIHMEGDPDEFAFHDNVLIEQRAYFRGIRDKEIYSNRSNNEFPGEIEIGGGRSIEIHNNQSVNIELRWAAVLVSDVDIHDNTGGSITLNTCNDCRVWSNNEILYVTVYHTENITVNGNRIQRGIYCELNEGLQIEGNLIEGRKSSRNNRDWIVLEINDSQDVMVRKNTILCWHPVKDINAVLIEDQSDVVFTGNILYGNGPFSKGLIVENSNVTNSYNCFGNLGSSVEGIELGEGDIEDDPLFTGGNPYEVELRWDSPCIDAGDPNADEDPDGTRVDIGMITFDQRQNPAPVIVSKWQVNASREWYFQYEAVAIDDGDYLELEFVNLPNWLRIEQRDDVESRVILEGIVPSDQADFTFIISAQDREESVDTLTVVVDVLEETIISGELPEVLSMDHSPYIVHSDLLVASDSSLTIEAGVEVIFTLKPIDTLDYQGEIPSEFIVEGDINIIGTEDLGVRLWSGQPNHSEYTWGGLVVNAGNTPVEFEYLTVEDAIEGISIVNRPEVNITNSHIGYCEEYGLEVDSSNHVRIESSNFYSQPYGAMIYHSHTIQIYECIVNRCNMTGLMAFGKDIDIVDCNIFENGLTEDWDGFGLKLYVDSSAVLSGTRILRNMMGLWFDSENEDAQLILNENVISDNARMGIFGRFAGDCILSENIISNNSNWGIYGERREIRFSQIEHNLFDNHGRNIHDIHDIPDGFGLLDSLNANDDSCDVFGNIFLSPEFIGFGDYPYHVRGSSPAIDAGNPERASDSDRSVSDIGYGTFDHDNTRPQFTEPFYGGERDIAVEVGTYRIFEFYVMDGGNPDPIRSRLTKSHEILYDVYRDSIFFWEPGFDTVLFEVTDGNDVNFAQFNIRIFTEYENSEDAIHLPLSFQVSDPFPNPFNNSVNISFTLPSKETASLTILDLSGREVAQLLDGTVIPGSHRVMWDASDVPSGLYFARLQAGEEAQTQRLVLVR